MSLYDDAWSGRLPNATPAEIWWREFIMAWVHIADRVRSGSQPRRSGALSTEQLYALFAAHCECRPLDVDRAEHEHSHDCDSGVLEHIQAALNAADADEQGTAMLLCVGHWQHDMASGIYGPLLRSALERPPMTIQAWNAREDA